MRGMSDGLSVESARKQNDHAARENYSPITMEKTNAEFIRNINILKKLCDMNRSNLPK